MKTRYDDDPLRAMNHEIKTSFSFSYQGVEPKKISVSVSTKSAFSASKIIQSLDFEALKTDLVETEMEIFFENNSKFRFRLSLFKNFFEILVK